MSNAAAWAINLPDLRSRILDQGYESEETFPHAKGYQGSGRSGGYAIFNLGSQYQIDPQ